MNSVLSNIIHLTPNNVNTVFYQAVLQIYRFTEELLISDYYEGAYFV